MLQVVDRLQQEKPKTAWMITNGISAGPKTAISTPHNTTDIAQALSTSLDRYVLGFQGLAPWRRIRCASSRSDERRLPNTLRGKNSQKVSPKRDDAGSSGVATRTWWPRLCSM